jgi:transcriptional regulator with XRE-family HTH domain
VSRDAIDAELADFKRRLAARVSELRRAHRLNQRDAASAALMAQQQYLRLEKGMVNPRVESLIRIAHAYNMSLNKFLDSLWK